MKRILYNTFRKLSAVVLDFLFPVACIGCGSGEDWVCSRCRGVMPAATTLACFICHRSTTDGRWCEDCGKQKALLGVWAATRYDTRILQRAIRVMKYKSQYVFARALSFLLVRFFAEWPFLFSPATLFVPVPLHPKKMRERGYNQSHLLVAHMLQAMGAATCGCWLLARTRHTKQQVDCTRDERLVNVVDAFHARHGTYTQRIVLVDDVATTGATLEACAHALRAAGAREVWGFVVASG